MLIKFLRALLGLALLPTCYALARSFCLVLLNSNAPLVEGSCLLAGIVVFIICWFIFPHPVKAYVFGHELTHVIWGLLFFAKPSKFKVGSKGGSVNLTKTNVLITLAPYFFPFYTFLIIAIALIVELFVEPLPFIPLWLFMIGLTWAFHVFFTFETLCQSQPDIIVYGKMFSWPFIFIVNAIFVLLWVGVVTSTLSFTISSICSCTFDAYRWVYYKSIEIISLFMQ